MNSERLSFHDEDGDAADRSAFAPLNRAHLTHEPVRRPLPWARFAGSAVFGALVVEALRLVLGR